MGDRAGNLSGTPAFRQMQTTQRVLQSSTFPHPETTLAAFLCVSAVNQRHAQTDEKLLTSNVPWHPMTMSRKMWHKTMSMLTPAALCPTPNLKILTQSSPKIRLPGTPVKLCAGHLGYPYSWSAGLQTHLAVDHPFVHSLIIKHKPLLTYILCRNQWCMLAPSMLRVHFDVSVLMTWFYVHSEFTSTS